MTDDERAEIVAGFRRELESWRGRNPTARQAQQLKAFTPHALWERAGGNEARALSCDRQLYRELMIAAGYLVKER